MQKRVLANIFLLFLFFVNGQQLCIQGCRKRSVRLQMVVPRLILKCIEPYTLHLMTGQVEFYNVTDSLQTLQRHGVFFFENVLFKTVDVIGKRFETRLLPGSDNDSDDYIGLFDETLPNRRIGRNGPAMGHGTLQPASRVTGSHAV